MVAKVLERGLKLQVLAVERDVVVVLRGSPQGEAWKGGPPGMTLDRLW